MERIHVSVRPRPLSPDDAETSPWRISGNSIAIPNHSHYRFDFDCIFSEDSNTKEVYNAHTRDIVSAAVRGFNGTVFAYGQTSSGKTHTMRGSTTEPGVIPLAVRDLFDIVQQDGDREFLLRMSYMEIYNEEINDLLAPEHRKLQIHESLERGIYVAGLREEIVASPEQVLDLMSYGESHRHIGETNMNVYSSRSHTIFRMIIESRDRNEDEVIESSCDAVRVSVLNLVDLAGSERAAKTGAEGIRLKEGSHINKSLMTLGTVIKKLSEGTENQGGHIPYRDSKLTRILQPALGGNANTAIICNITLAQIHADETKSSLQFASRALRVTNCAQVNEILTDAALLKRQKKEIEELRAKLQASHSEHSEDEILSLRNKLLQTELERERIALELEEGKKAQAEREKRLQEQAKKIKNLSSMVLYSNRDEKCDYVKKEKRRYSWCPGILSRVTSKEASSTVKTQESTEDPTRSKRSAGPLLPFEELVNESGICKDSSCGPLRDDRENVSDDCTLPDPGVLLHVTNRRKVPVTKKCLPPENKELAELQAEYEELFLKFETERTVNAIHMDCLLKELGGNDVQNFNHQDNKNTDLREKAVTLRESEAILVIKQLQQQIKMLEMEKSSSQKNLDSVVELATEQNICAIEKFDELSEELLYAREEAREVRERLASSEYVSKIDESLDSFSKLSTEIHNIMSEVQESAKLVESLSLLLDESYRSFSSLSHMFPDIKSIMHHTSTQQISIVSDHKKLHTHLVQKVSELEDEKSLLYNQSVDLQKEIHQLKLDIIKNEKSLTELLEQHDGEKLELLSVIEAYEKEKSSLSSSFLVKEKENLRKDLEKTKARLKDLESKFKNAIQEKTKLKGEKAFAERELKRVQGQKAFLERDINKRDSVTTKRSDSAADSSFDPRKTKVVQDEHKKMEVFAFEMETTVASLEEELAAARREKEKAVSNSERLASELEFLSEKLHASNLETYTVHEEVSRLKSRLEEHQLNQQRLESCTKKLEEEKESIAMQLTDSLLEMEEEKALWSSKERALIEAIEEKSKLYNAEIMSLLKGMSEVKNELETCRNDCKILEEKLACMEETTKQEKECSMQKSMQLDRLKTDLESAIAESNQSRELVNYRSQVEELTQKISSLEEKMHQEKVNSNKDQAKLRMRLRGTQAKSEAYLFRYKEEMEEKELMRRKFEEASKKLKRQLSEYGIEVLDLKRQLASAQG